MSRGSCVSNIAWASAQPITLNPVTPAQSILGLAAFGISVRLAAGSTGTLAGTFKLQVTDFGGGPGGSVDSGYPPVETDWGDLSGSPLTWAGTTLMFSVRGLGQKFVRVFFTDAGSTGIPTVDIAFTGHPWAGA